MHFDILHMSDDKKYTSYILNFLSDSLIYPSLNGKENMVSGVYWTKGNYVQNEDSLALEIVHTSRGECALMVVADGIGSFENSEEVSGYICEAFSRWFHMRGIKLWNSPRYLIKRSLCRVTNDCYETLICYASNNKISCGSTCSLICIWKKRFVYMQIGDSQAFYIGKNKMARPLLKPHRNNKGQLINCIGNVTFPKPEFYFGKIKKGEKLLAASDGFYEPFGCDEIAGFFRSNEKFDDSRLEKRLAAMGKESLRRGNNDNKSAICIERRE